MARTLPPYPSGEASSPVAGRAGPRRGGAFAGVVAATLCCFVAVGAVLPVLPGFVRGPLGAGDLAVGVVIGAYTVTGLVGRPFAGRAADRRGRRRAMAAGAVAMALAGALYLVPAGVAGLLAARLVLGAGEALVVTAGGAWVVTSRRPIAAARPSVCSGSGSGAAWASVRSPARRCSVSAAIPRCGRSRRSCRSSARWRS